MIFPGAADQSAPDQRTGREIEGIVACLQGEAPNLFEVVRALGQILLPQGEPALRRIDLLNGNPVDQPKTRPQALVPGHHPIQRPTQPGAIQSAVQAQSE